MLKIEFRTSGAAFCDDYTGEPDTYSERMEIKRILKEIIADIDCGHTHEAIMDINGNKIGEWSID